jgi:hypothetical protein
MYIRLLTFICIQRPQWRNHSVEVLEDAAAQEEDNLFADEDSGLPKLGHHEVGTTASEFDGAFDAAGDEDEGTENIGIDDDKSDDVVSADERKRRRNSKKVCNDLCPSQA